MSDLRKIDEGLLRKNRIGAHTEYFCIFCLKLGIIFVRTGRSQLLDSSRAIVQHINIDKHVFPLKAAQL
jgi:hypothetical protein